MINITGEKPRIIRSKIIKGFNDQSVEFGKTLTQEQLLEKAISYRSEILEQLKKLPESTFSMAVSGRNSFTVASFLQYLFVSHSTHHKKQIEEFLSVRHQ